MSEADGDTHHTEMIRQDKPEMQLEREDMMQ